MVQQAGNPLTDAQRREAEAAVVKAARDCFARTTVNGVTYVQSPICTWNVPALVDAVRRLEGAPR